MSTTIGRHAETPSRPFGPNAAVSFIRRHNVAAFYVLAFAFTWGGFLLIVGPEGFFATGSVIGGLAAVTIAGPAVAGVLMTGVVDGREGLRELSARLRRWQVGARWYAVALLTGPLVMGGTVLGLSLLSPEFRPDILTGNDKLSVVAMGLAIGLVGPLLEELGWTGFALPRIRQRFGVFATGLGMGLLWAVWHFPLFAGERDAAGVVPAVVLVGAFLFAWLPAYRVLMVWLYDRTDSLLLAWLMHVPISALTFILVTSGASATAAVAKVLVWGALFWLIIGAVAWANGGHLTRRSMHQV